MRTKLKIGGEGGIRTKQDGLDSVSYRFDNARVAADASDAVAPCTLMHASLGGSPASSIRLRDVVGDWSVLYRAVHPREGAA